jgi:hypothetical protein
MVLKNCLHRLFSTLSPSSTDVSLALFRRHGFFFDFFRSSSSVAMSGAFQWHQLS